MMKYSVTVLLLLVCSYCPGQGNPVVQPSFGMRVASTPIPVKIDGKLNLIYELHLTNFSGSELHITALEVLNSDSIRITIFDENAIIRRLHQPGKKPGAGRASVIDAGCAAIVYIEMIENVQTRAGIHHRLTFRNAGQEVGAASVIRGAAIAFADDRPVMLGAPLRGGAWAAIHDASWERGHRRVIYTVDGQARIPGRFAIDFMKLDNNGMAASGAREEVKNWYGYGLDVLAVADGIIATTRSDFTESPTLSAHPDYASHQATGNYISMAIGHGRFVFYEHLKPGSIRVKPGQKVKKGDVIASLGFTGQTTGPHLHFHVADNNSPLGAEGQPFTFENFNLLGNYPDFSVFDKATWKSMEKGGVKVKGEHPGTNVVISFD